MAAPTTREVFAGAAYVLLGDPTGDRFPIAGVNQGTKTFTVTGDVTAVLANNDSFRITGSTGNDGLYTVNGVPAFGGVNSTVVVDQVIPNATVDGAAAVGTEDALNMVELGLLPDVRIRTMLSKQSGNNEKGQVLANHMFTRGLKTVEVQLTLFNSSATIMAAFITEAIVGTDSLGLTTDYAKIAPTTMVIIPEGAKGEPATDLRKFWFPGIKDEQLAEFAYTMAEGRETTNPYTVTFYGGVRYTDQAGAAIPDGYRMAFRGDPADADLTWFLPAGY